MNIDGLESLLRVVYVTIIFSGVIFCFLLIFKVPGNKVKFFDDFVKRKSVILFVAFLGALVITEGITNNAETWDIIPGVILVIVLPQVVAVIVFFIYLIIDFMKVFKESGK